MRCPRTVSRTFFCARGLILLTAPCDKFAFFVQWINIRLSAGRLPRYSSSRRSFAASLVMQYRAKTRPKDR